MRFKDLRWRLSCVAIVPFPTGDSSLGQALFERLLLKMTLGSSEKMPHLCVWMCDFAFSDILFFSSINTFGMLKIHLFPTGLTAESIRKNRIKFPQSEKLIYISFRKKTAAGQWSSTEDGFACFGLKRRHTFFLGKKIKVSGQTWIFNILGLFPFAISSWICKELFRKHQIF